MVDGGLLRDTWIYVQEPDVQLGRLQIFNNWSPYLVADPSKVWIGLEYFCYETDDLWKMPDEELTRFAIAEVEKIGILNAADVSDGHVVRVPKTYPAYFGTYDRFDELRGFTDSFENLFLVGRNGMHKYNNQDHSMLTARSLAYEARDTLLEAEKIDPAALEAGAPTSLGVLYYRVPSFPIAFGDTDLARKYLEEAVRNAPNGMDANYFYGDFLNDRGDYAGAQRVWKHALTIPVNAERPVWDKARRQVIQENLAKLAAKGN